MTKIPLKAASTVFLLAFTVLMAPLTTPANVSSDASTGSENDSFKRIGLPVGVVIGVTTLGYWLTPMDEWQSEIQKLTEDEMFIQRWMLFNDDPATLEKGKRALARIQKEKKAKQKKLRRLQKWAYPAITLVGASAMMLTFWLRGD